MRWRWPHEPDHHHHAAQALAVVAQVIRYAAALAIGAAMAWGAQGWRLGEQVQSGKTALETLQREHAESLTRATASALNATIAWQKAKDDAIDRAQARAKTQAANAAAARTERDSLRDTLASARLRLPGATPGACTEYATASSGLLDQCAAQYQELARSCDGHVSDVRLMQEAWPAAAR